MNIKIKDIAAIARVSPATVSLALNDKPGISKTTRKKILEIARTLRDERNKKQTLTQVTRGAIRFLKIVKHGQILNRDHEVFIARYIDGLEQEARQSGYNLEINTFHTSDIRETIAHIKDAAIDGLIVLGTELSEQDLEPFEHIDFPIGFIDTQFHYKRFDFIDMDNTQAMFQIVKHLIEQNHRKIGMIRSTGEARNFELRYLGFQEALKYFSIPYENKYIYPVRSTFDGAYQDMLQLLKKGVQLPTALFSSNDLIAYGCIKAFKEIGVTVPEDLSIIGFDDLPMSAMMEPLLTTMKVSQRQIGQMAIRLLMGRIQGTYNAPTVKVNIGGELIYRKSVKKL